MAGPPATAIAGAAVFPAEESGPAWGDGTAPGVMMTIGEEAGSDVDERAVAARMRGLERARLETVSAEAPS
jgi:hypothetical protein